MVVQVVADEVRRRSAPDLDAPIVGTLERGAVARVETGPVESDGFEWFEIVDLDGNRGWAATSDQDDQWLVALNDELDGNPLLRFESACDVSPPVAFPLTVFDDGMTVVARFKTDGRWQKRQLSPTGLDRFSQLVLDSPYLQAGAQHRHVRRAGAGEPPGHGLCLYTFTVQTAAAPIIVTSESWFGAEEEAVFYEPSPAIQALDRLASALGVIDDALGPDAWADEEPLPFVAGSFLIWLSPSGGPAPSATVRLDAELLEGRPEEFGDPGASPGERCGYLSVAQAFELSRLSREAGIDLELDRLSGGSLTTDDGRFDFLWSPRAPDGYPDCAAISQ